MKKILLDAREMIHPEPLQVSMRHLKSMSSEEYLYMINKKNPIPLIEIAIEKGFAHLSHLDNDEVWHIIISKNFDQPLEELLDV